MAPTSDRYLFDVVEYCTSQWTYPQDTLDSNKWSLLHRPSLYVLRSGDSSPHPSIFTGRLPDQVPAGSQIDLTEYVTEWKLQDNVGTFLFRTNNHPSAGTATAKAEVFFRRRTKPDKSLSSAIVHDVTVEVRAFGLEGGSATEACVGVAREVFQQRHNPKELDAAIKRDDWDTVHSIVRSACRPPSR
jgi:hypothetical protein